MDKRAPSVTTFKLNGHTVDITPAPGERLSVSLRERLDARDVKVGCNAGDCGACTVLVDGAPVCACLMPTHQAQGAEIETLSGLTDTPEALRLRDAFLDRGAAQCGICTPGMLVTATALLRATAKPDATAVEDALGGVLCRCTGYRKIIDAVVAAGHGTTEHIAHDGSVGTPIHRVDGAGKVDGTEAFGDDIGPAGALELHIIRSPYHRARFAIGDMTLLLSRPGIEAVLTADDIPGQNSFGVIPGFEDQPVFAEEETRFRGEAVAAVVGTQDAIASLKESDVPVVWTELPSALGFDGALSEDAPSVHSDRAGNIMCRGQVRRGDAATALAKADTSASGTFTTSFVEHAYIEPEAGFAELQDGRIHVHACTQAPVMDREGLSRILGRPEADIRIVPTGVGGGFGSKLDLSIQPYLALAALKTGQPVRHRYSRTASMQSTTKRHPGRLNMEIGADASGRISGFRFHGDFDTGAYASWGPTVANRVPVHASGPYAVSDYNATTAAIHTNAPPSGAFRGFGVPQTAIAQEVLFDELAEKLDIDPLEFRLKNALTNGVPTVCGQIFDQGVGISACLEALRPAWEEAKAKTEAYNVKAAENGSPLRQGVGLAAGWYGCGNTSLPNPSTIKAGFRADGALILHQGATDIGQGSNTVIAQIFAEALGIPLNAITLVGGDTDITPDAGKTSASRQTFVSGNAARLTGEALRADILRRSNASPSASIQIEGTMLRISDSGTVRELDLTSLAPDGEGFVLRAEETYDPPTKPLDKNGQGIPYAQFGYAAHLAEVEVDLALGTTRATRFVAAHDVGRAINPVLVEGQVHGGIAQGLGMALMEEYLPGRTENLHDYLIPTIGDVPPIETVIVEEPDAHGPYGAKGLGEHVLIPTAPALLNAIARATGVRLRQVPVTPSALFTALKEAQR